MKQQLSDFWARLRGDRKTQFISGIVVLCLLFLIFSDGGTRRRVAPQQKPVSVGQNDPSEQWRDLVQRFDQNLKQLSSQTSENSQNIEKLQKTMADNESTTAEIFKKILERLAEVQSQASMAVNNTSPNPRSLDDLDGGMPATGNEELETIGANDNIAAGPPPKPTPKMLAYVGPGDSVRVKLLAGVNAPTDGTPYPVVFKLIGDITGPDGSSLPLGEARLIAAAQGSLSDHRALFRLTKISIRLPNGRRKEFGIDGWVVGEDGIRGMEGILIDPIGQAIGGGLMAGGLSGLGEGIAASNTTNRSFSSGQRDSYVENNKLPEYAGGVALSSAASTWQKIIQDRLAQMVPVVQVYSGREATAVFSQSLAIPDLYDQLDDEEPALAFNSLD